MYVRISVCFSIYMSVFEHIYALIHVRIYVYANMNILCLFVGMCLCMCVCIHV
jgi:hypothetical protein